MRSSASARSKSTSASTEKSPLDSRLPNRAELHEEAHSRTSVRHRLLHSILVSACAANFGVNKRVTMEHLVTDRCGMTPWWWLSVLTVTLPVYVALRRTRSIWIATAAFVAGFVLAAALEGMLASVFNLMTGTSVAFADAIAHATQFPMKFLLGLLLTVAGALNPARLFMVPYVVDDILQDQGLRSSCCKTLLTTLRPHRHDRRTVCGRDSWAS